MYCSNCFLNSTVCVSLQPSPPSAIHCLTFQTTPLPYLLSERTSSSPKHFCLFDCFLLWDTLISLNSAFYFILQAAILSWLRHCLPFSQLFWWAVSCFTQTYASCCSFEIFNHVQINIWLLQFSFLVLLNHCCLSSDISGMLQPGSFWFLNNATSGFSMTVGALICPIYKIW